MRIILMGGHDLGKRTLKYLIEKGKNIVAVVTDTKDDWYKGVDVIAEEYGLTLFKNVDINSDQFINSVTKLEPDLIVVVNFQQILKEKIIAIPKFGCINTHASLLPQYRGRAPLNWALIHGEKQVGVTVHFIETGIDTGNIIVQQPIDVDNNEYIDSVLDKVAKVYPTIVNTAIDKIKDDKTKGVKQNLNLGSYYGKRTPEDGEINWNDEAVNIINLIRAISKPYPGAYSYYEGEKIVFWKAEIANQLDRHIIYSNGQIISLDNKGICIKAKTNNILITEYETINSSVNISAGSSFIYVGKNYV